MKDRLKNSMATVLILAAVLVARPANADLVAHWKFDETSGTTVRDSSGNGYDGKVVAGAPIWDSNGKYDGCLDFGGRSGVELPGEVFSDISEAITVSLWVNLPPDQPAGVDVIFQAGTHDGEGSYHRIVSIYCRWEDDEVDFRTGYGEHKANEEWREAKLKTRAGKWEHYVFVSDATRRFQGIYVNGLLVAKGRGTVSMSAVTRANIGIALDQARRKFSGKLDDIRIYNHGLNLEEVRELYRFGPGLLKLCRASREGQVILDEQDPQDAIAYLENRLSETERWRRENPDADTSYLRELLFDLNFLLAKAKQAAGRPKKEVDVAYRRASREGVPSFWRCPSVLQWLQENGETAEYARIVRSLTQECLDSQMKEVVAKAEQMLLEGEAKVAVKFLEANLDAATLWQKEHRPDGRAAVPSLPAVYFQLAKVRKAAQMPKKQVAEAYAKAFGPFKLDFEGERAAALIWLFENEFTNEYTEAINSLSRRAESDDSVKEIVGTVCKHFESKKDWAGFERFLDTLFTQTKNPAEWMMVVESSLSDKTNRWAKGYFRYIADRPALKFSSDCAAADRCLADEEFEKAARLYKDILNRCGSTDDKALFEFRLCKSLFSADRPAEVIAMLESFAGSYGATHPRMAAEALLMKGRSHLQLGEIDKALEEFRQVSAEFPQTEQAPEADFFTGYCYMLQSKSAKAAETLERVAKDHPESLWAAKARLCLTLQEAAK
jgi:TolA-binding protein